MTQRTRLSLFALAPCLLGLLAPAPARAQSAGGPAPSPAWQVVATASAAWIAGTEREAAAAWRDTLAVRENATHAWLSLAVLAREAFDWSGADSLQQRARVALTRDPRVASQREAFAAVVWYETVRSANARGEYRQATQAMDSVIARARAAHDTVTLATALAGAATLRGRAVSAAAQRATLDSLAPIRQFQDSRLTLRESCLRAGSSAEHDLDAMAAVLAIARDVTEPRDRGFCLFAAGTQFSERGQQYSTSVLLDSALVSFGRGRAPSEESAVLQWLGNLYARGGQFARADGYLAEALRIAAASGNRALMAWIHINLATTAQARGDRERAERSVLLARELAEAAGDGYAIADADAAYAGILLEHEDWPALEAHLAAGETAPQPLPATAQRFFLRANMAVQRGDFATARLMVAGMDSIARLRGPNWRPSVTTNRAWLELRDGQARVAATMLDTVRVNFGRAQFQMRLFIDAALAEAYLALGMVDSAITALDNALVHIDARVQNEPTNRLRAQVANLQQPFGGRRAADAPRAAAVGIAKAGRVSAAFAQSERLRARALLEALLLASPVREESAAERAVRRAEQYAPATLASAQAALPDDRTALVSFLTGPADVGTVALVVTRDEAHAVALPSVDSLAPLIQRLTAALMDGANDRRLRALRDGLARQLGDALLAPVLRLVPSSTQHLVVIADDILHRVPFAALRPGGRSLPSTMALSTVPSAAIAQLVWRGREPVGLHAVVLAAPDVPIEGDR
jgi:tetratricopeptide (TPR) repeat protein